MKYAEAKLVSAAPYEQNGFIKSPKKSGEQPADYEERTWRERCTTTDDGYVLIPPMAFANSLKSAAKYLSIQKKGHSTWTKHFISGVLVFEGIKLPIKALEVKGLKLFLPSDGKRGGGSRVQKIMPVIPSWKGTVTYNILDNEITENIFMEVLIASGTIIGIGGFRAENWGTYGRFNVEKLDWAEE